jgi:hypothetical protein
VDTLKSILNIKPLDWRVTLKITQTLAIQLYPTMSISIAIYLEIAKLTFQKIFS